MRRLTLQVSAVLVGALCLFGGPAAEAAPLYDVGPGGPIATGPALGENSGIQVTVAPAVPTQAPSTSAAQPQASAVPELVAATVVETRLPSWVQVVVAKAPLYAADGSSNQALAQLSRYTFLRVVAGGSQRLQVQTYDESGTPGQTGWVDAEQVLPSAAATDWLVASSATSLWSTNDSSGSKVRNIDRFTPLQKIDTSGSRMLVRVYRSDFSGIVDQGWVDASATGPALAPQVRVPSADRSVGLARPTSTIQQQDFLDAAARAARVAASATGVPASVTVAQAILESDWGRSGLALNANNYFGMKAMGTLGDDGVVWLPTSEYDDSGQLYETISAFRAYKSLTDSMADHDRLLQTLSRYSSAMKVASDPKQFAQQIALDGYSTDPAYADKLIALMDRYNLYSLDG